jgi:cellobiose phosphorylase
LGLEANAVDRSLTVQPVLPDWLNDLELVNLNVGAATVTLRFWREDEQTKWKVMRLDGELTVYEKD